MEPAHSFGYWLRRRRKALDLTQAALAQVVGCSAAAIRKIEADERRPSPETAARLASVCDIPLGEQAAFMRFARGLGTKAPGPAAEDAPWRSAPAAGQVLSVAIQALLTQTPPAAPPLPVNNLPAPISRFFGRETEIVELLQRLADNRLVTLIGPGGVGKTRLSLQAVPERLADFSGGVWQVELAPLSEPALLAQQVAGTLGLREQPGQPALATLTAFLRDRQALLVLDNCEHLLLVCAQLAEALLHACPQLKILATSREALRVAGEALLPVPSLPFPAPGQIISVEQLGEYAAANLFVDRARLVLPGYAVSRPRAAAVARICQRVDGIPLAIEMAAARLRLFDTETVADQLDDALGLLTSGTRTAPPKHQTLRGVIDWSYALLSTTERLLLARLAAFAGGCTLEAASAVCSGHGLEASQVVDGLTTLVDKSLVGVQRPGGENRYQLLETVRQYAREKLEAAGEVEQVGRRQRDYYLELVETASYSNNVEWLAWLQKMKADADNMRLALDWSFQHLEEKAEVEAAIRLLLYAGGHQPSNNERLEWCQRLLAVCERRADIAPPLHAKFLSVASNVAAADHPELAMAWAQRGLEISRSLGEPVALMDALFAVGAHYLDHELAEPAQAAYDEGEAIFLRLGPDALLPHLVIGKRSYITFKQAQVANLQGRYEDAKRLSLESIHWCDAGDQHQHAEGPLISYGIACLGLANYALAREYFLQAYQLTHDQVNPYQVAKTTRWLAQTDLLAGNLERGLDYCRECLQHAAQAFDNNFIASGFGLAAAFYAKQGRPQAAALLAGAAQALYARQNRKPWEDSSLDTLLPGWRAQTNQAVLSQAFAAGQSLEVQQATAFVIERAEL